MPKYRQTYTLFKRGKYYYYRTYSPDGVRTTAHTTGKTSLTAARLYCDELFKEGKLSAGKGKTLAEYAAGFFDDKSVYVQDNNLSPRSAVIYRETLENTLLPMFGGKELSDITQTAVKKARQELLGKGLAARTVNLKMKVLHIILKSALMDGVIQRDPFANLRTIPQTGKVRDALTIKEVSQVYEAADNEMKPRILLLALTGMRISEMAATSKEELAESDGIPYIHLEKQLLDNKFSPLKTKKPRDIPISRKLIFLVDGYFFDHLRIIVRDITPKIRLIPDWKERGLCPHSLRHFFISSAKSYGINHLKVEAIAGHSLKGIQEVYTNFNVSDLADIIEWQEWAYCQITGKTLD